MEYDKKIAKLYNDYGWDYFSISMGNAILDYFKSNNIYINNHLDLACGVGTLCNIFYERKISTKGIDISDDMIEIAKENYGLIDFIKADIINYISIEKYDLITCTCDAINHILNISDVKKVLENIYGSLNSEGYFIFDIYDDKEIKLDTTIISKRNNNVNVEYYCTKKNNELINTNVKILKHDNILGEFNITEKIYKVEDILNIAKNIGFKIEKSSKKIMNEKQRFKDKMYIILKK